ncbi:MAG: SusC/RagA family TonB-linked outer membrane protein [Sphingobacteriaceae bacterium]
MKKKLLSIVLGLIFVSLQVIAQEMTITGVVTSAEDGMPLPGVSVKVKDTSTGTITGPDGEFRIRASKGQVLTFSFIGSSTAERIVGDEAIVNVTLASDSKSLSEVVVVGYGSQRKGNLTGAVTTIDVKKTLEGRPIADVGRAMQGVAPGLSVTLPGGGEVGSDPIVKIRGAIGSMVGGSSPLILLDNVEIPSIQLVNPGDVASISILKDAAASSIYGAKAAFGVILITTKKGSGTDKPSITYSNNFSFQNPYKDLKMADVNALRYTVEAAERIGTFTPTGAFYLVDRASYEKAVEWKEKYGNTIGSDDPTVYGRDWVTRNGSNKLGYRTYNPYDALIEEWAPTSLNNLSIGGAAGKTTYNIGLAAFNQSGMMKPAKKDEFTRYNASLKLSSDINKYLTIRGGAIYSRRNKEYAYITSSTTADPWLYVYRWGPLYPFGNDDRGPIRSPASEAAAANTANILQNYLNFNAGATVNIRENWKVDFDYSFSNQEENWNKPGTRYTAGNSWVAPRARVDASGNPVYVDSEGQVVASTAPGAMLAYDLSVDTYTAPGANPDHIRREAENFRRQTINATTTYDLDIQDNHKFKFLLGLNRVTDDLESQYTQINGLADINNPQFEFGTGTVTGGGDRFWEAQLGYFGRINYAFKDKYLFEGNLRYDGSSKFPTDLKWRWFPSFSAGWVASEESFMKWTSPVLNSLKFRGSWGSIGDQTVPNNLYISTMPGGLTNWISGGSRAIAVGTPRSVSPFITWQDIVTTNLAVDAFFLNNRLSLTAEIFRRNTNNMIVPAEGVPVTFGAGAPQSNYGDLQTKGWELSASFNHRFKNGLGINLRGNVVDTKSIIKAYGTTQSVNGNYVGKVWGDIWGYRTDRLYQMDDFELDGAGKPQLITLTAAESTLHGNKSAYKLKPGPNGEKPVYQPFIQTSSNFRTGPGDVKFVDLNGDGEISNGSGTLTDHGDLEIIGNSTPRYEYGFNLGADFKGFDINTFFQGVGSRKIWGSGFLAIPGFNPADGAMPAAIADNYWTPENPGAFYPAAFGNGGSNTANNMQIQSRYLLNMAYLRLKNVSLGYTLPKSLLKRVGINSLRIYTSLENIITWDKLGGLPIDPETVSGYSMFNPTDALNYNGGRTGAEIPTFKSVSFGAQLNF